jgi:uncharacterized protein
MKLIYLMCVLIVGLSSGCARTPSVELRGQRFEVEVVDNDQTRARGMMFRDSLEKNHGMLFVFEETAMRSFWMHNCKISLDILYFDEQLKLVGQALSVPPCNLSPEQCPNYSSNAPARYVLETNAGVAKTLGVALGDTLTLDL